MDQHDRKSMQQLLIDRIERLHGYVQRQIPPRFQPLISADDILQEVWIAAYQAIDGLKGKGDDEVDRWLTTITKRKLIDTLRAIRASKRGDGKQFADDTERRMTSFCDLFTILAAPENTPSREFRVTERAHTVGIFLAALPEDRRKVIELRYVDGLTHREIARELNRSEAAVNSLLFHGLKQLRMMLGEAKGYLSV
jgi:RNA polymerase sigma-70 factor (subfamily 1)